MGRSANVRVRDTVKIDFGSLDFTPVLRTDSFAAQNPAKGDMQVKKSGMATDRPRRWQFQFVRRVADCYLRMRHLEPMVAQNLDETPGARSMRWQPETCNFSIDVEHAVRDAIKAHVDAPDLAKAWRRYLEDDSVMRGTERKLIAILAPVFDVRELEPKEYFTPRRYPIRRHGR